MSLTTSNTGLELIKKFEGCKLTSYQDSAGTWTIGYGHTSKVTEGMTITQEQADAYLKSDLATAESAVNKYDSTYGWNQNQFDALVSFAFNIGNIKQLTNSGKRTIAEISEKIPAYNKAGGKVVTGLVNRRAAEKELFDTAVATAAASSSSTTTSSASTTSSTSSSTVSVDAAAKKESGHSKGTKLTTTSKLNMRTGAGTSKSLIKTLDKGATVTWYGYYTSVLGVKWYLIADSTGQNGFVCSKYVK